MYIGLFVKRFSTNDPNFKFLYYSFPGWPMKFQIAEKFPNSDGSISGLKNQIMVDIFELSEILHDKKYHWITLGIDEKEATSNCGKSIFFNPSPNESETLLLTLENRRKCQTLKLGNSVNFFWHLKKNVNFI